MITFLKKVWTLIVKFGAWLVFSSANAEQISTTFKGLATLIVPILLVVLKAYNVNIDNAIVSKLIDNISATIIVVFGLVGSIATVIGGLRKIWKTVDGTNDVIASFSR